MGEAGWRCVGEVGSWGRRREWVVRGACAGRARGVRGACAGRVWGERRACVFGNKC